MGGPFRIAVRGPALTAAPRRRGFADPGCAMAAITAHVTSLNRGPPERLVAGCGTALFHARKCCQTAAAWPATAAAGLRGARIPLDAQIIHEVDIFDALTTDRPYRAAYDIPQAIALLEEGAGHMTDPELTELFIETIRQYMAADPAGFRARFGHSTENEKQSNEAR